MRLLIADTDEHGRSRLQSSTEVDRRMGPQVLWECGPAEHVAAASQVPADARRAAKEPAPGGVRWQFAHLESPFEVPSHSTRTVDYKYIVSGAMLMILDDETVELREGDLVVLLAARHGFANSGEQHADVLTLLAKPVLEDE
jgi:mannose-6-phosphate isomerase-like protein (cupin superfamily)